MNFKSFLLRSQVERFALRLQACMRGAHFFCASVLSFSNIWWLSFSSLEYECQKLHYSVSLLALGTFVDPESHEEFQSRRLSSPLPTLLCSSSISLWPSTPTPLPRRAVKKPTATSAYGLYSKVNPKKHTLYHSYYVLKASVFTPVRGTLTP